MRKLNALLTLFFAVAFTSAVQGQTNTGVNNAELNGNYTFGFSGISGNGTISSGFGSVGRFTADGAGNLTNGELVSNTVGAGASSPRSFTGTYAIGADHRGVMNLNVSGGTAKLAFAMMANGNAQLIEFDASGGSGTIGSGTMEKADTSAYSTARITGDYAFGAAGFDNTNNRAAMAGRFTSNGTGTLTNAAGDVNAYGTDYSMNFTAANYTVSNASTGRGTMQLAFTFGGTPDTMNFVFYVVNSGKLFLMESDAVAPATPLLNGVCAQQQIPAGGFNSSSLNGNMVLYLTGFSVCSSGSRVPKAGVGLLTANGSGTLSLTWDENYCSAPNSFTNAAGTYSVAANGRTSITIGGNILVAYLESLNQAVLFDFDSNALFGFGEPQTTGSLNNTSLKGTYAGYATNPTGFGATVFSGEFTADGASPSGNMTGSEDIGASSGPVSGAAFKATYSVSPAPTNGRGTMTVTSGTGSNAVIYMVSPSKFVAVSLSDPNPTVLDFELSSAAGSVSLSSLSLNPTSVTGGNSSTGTVTLSGAAPASGAQVTLSSSNTAAAKVPSSVTVAAGATSATFTVTTSAVAASTTVSISAAYGGATRSASVTVTPASPPPPTLSSLGLNPASVIGGAQSSTGTVTLSRPAPAGGARVTLSSNNTTAASVPSIVTVVAGASSVTFTVSTSAVAGSTSVTITAIYSGASRSALLTVTPPPPTLASLALNPANVFGGQPSTGTVTLTAPAPAGGAQVFLSSNNGAATVPSSVTVPVGATSATFTVKTSFVLISTSAAISATYNGTTRTATLGILL